MFHGGGHRLGARLWLWLAVVSGRGWLVGAKVVVGKLPQEPNFALFATKFCFDYLQRGGQDVVGKATLELQRPSPWTAAVEEPVSGKLLFLVYDDETTHWKQMRHRWERTSCAEKRAAASACVEMRLGAGRANATQEVRISQAIRPRFWYFAVVACDAQLQSQVRYRLHLSNELWGWQSEFSFDHMGLFGLYAAALAAFGAAAFVTAVAAGARAGGTGPRMREHPYLQLLLLSYAASLVSCVLYLAHYSLFAKDGSGSKRIRFLAVLASIVANCTVFLIAILCSAGWAITSFAVPNRRSFLAAIVSVGAVTALTELRAESGADREQSRQMYSHQSGPGVLGLVIKIFIFCWFAYQTKASHDEEAQGKRRRFYKILGVSMGGWCLSAPVAVLLAFQLSPTVRYKTVVTLEVLARLLGQLALSRLLCGPLSPVAAENTFLAEDQAPYVGQL